MRECRAPGILLEVVTAAVGGLEGVAGVTVIVIVVAVDVMADQFCPQLVVDVPAAPAVKSGVLVAIVIAQRRVRCFRVEPVGLESRA